MPVVRKDDGTVEYEIRGKPAMILAGILFLLLFVTYGLRIYRHHYVKRDVTPQMRSMLKNWLTTEHVRRNAKLLSSMQGANISREKLENRARHFKDQIDIEILEIEAKGIDDMNWVVRLRHRRKNDPPDTVREDLLFVQRSTFSDWLITGEAGDFDWNYYPLFPDDDY